LASQALLLLPLLLLPLLGLLVLAPPALVSWHQLGATRLLLVLLACAICLQEKGSRQM
jgi:hypothetical protein